MDLDPQDMPSAQQQQSAPIINGFGSQAFEQQQQQHTPFQVSGCFGPINQAIPLPAPPSIMQPQSIAVHQPLQPPPADLDIDSCLLQQFSCLGTTDHEDLINQLQNLMNNQVNKETARFFLEMSNWNLQTAVCCYLDFFQLQTLPSMKIVEQSRPSESSQSWKLQNDGNEQWPTGCYLMSPNQTKRIEVPAIKSGDTCEIFADIPLSSPPIMWRLCTPNGWYFGETIWMIPSNSEDTAADLAHRMSQLRTTQQSTGSTTNSTSTESFPQVNVVILVKMD